MHNSLDKKNEKFSVKKRLKSFEYAFQGIKSFFISTHNARIHLAISVMVIIAAIYFKISLIEWIAVVYAIGLVFTAEAFNTAVEEWVDSIQPDYDKKAGRVKDISAGAVLIASIVAAVIGILIFGTRFYNLIFN